MIIKFKVENQRITRLDSNFVVNGTKNYLFAEFDFSEEWTGDIFEIFKNSELSKAYNQLIEDGRCTVPWEVLQNPGTLSVSVFGGDLITSNSVAIKLHESGYDENAKESMTPTPEAFEQLLQKVKQEFTMTNHSHENKDVIDIITEESLHKIEMAAVVYDLWNEKVPVMEEKISLIESKADKVEFVNPEFAVLDLSKAYNTVYNADVFNSLIINIPDGAYNNDFATALNFTAGDGILIDYPASGVIQWIGADCSTQDGYSLFIPVSGKRYNIIITFDGQYLVGKVAGFVPTSSNVPASEAVNE